MTAPVDPEDLRVALDALDRRGPHAPIVEGAVRRLRAVLAPTFDDVPHLPDPTVDAPGKSRLHTTSQRAALAAAPRSGTQRSRVLAAIAAAGDEGVTDDELEVLLSLAHPSPGCRRSELVAGGWVLDSGQRRVTRRGSQATVWVLSREGLRRLGSGRLEAS